MVAVSIISYLAGLSLWREPSTCHNTHEEPSAGPSTTPVSSFPQLDNYKLSYMNSGNCEIFGLKIFTKVLF